MAEENTAKRIKKLQFWVKRVQHIPWVAHIIRTVERFNTRDGNLYAGAITYFSVLAIVPILMFSFSFLGMFLDVFRPDLLGNVLEWVDKVVANNGQYSQLTDLIEGFIKGWQGVGLLGLITGLFVGLGWLENLQRAIRAVSQPDIGEKIAQNVVIAKLKSILVLVAVLILLALIFLSPVLGNWVSPILLRTFHISRIGRPDILIWLGSLVLTLLASFGFFLFIYRVLPGIKLHTKAYLAGSLIGAVLLTAIQNLGPLLVSVFSGNRGVQVFGAIIIVMLILNLFARLILYIGAWIATTRQPAVARTWTEADRPLMELDDLQTAPGHWEMVELDEDLSQSEEESEPAAQPEPSPQDNQAVLAKGWFFGATLGLGTMFLISKLPKLFARKKKNTTIVEKEI